MFLVLERNGRFSPAVGQIDPDLSIYELKVKSSGTRLTKALQPTVGRSDVPLLPDLDIQTRSKARRRQQWRT